MSVEPRREIKALNRVFHGGIKSAKSIDQSKKIIDLSSNINPLGPPEYVKHLIEKEEIGVYPDVDYTHLKQSIAGNLGISPDNVVVGNESVELIQAICLAYLEKGNKTVSFWPTFDEYRRCSQMMGAIYETTKLRERNAFRLDASAFKRLIKKIDPKIVFLCNPNNPTGYYFNETVFCNILSVCPNRLVVLDEAYVSFVKNF